jgi:hypothetical protein
MLWHHAQLGLHELHRRHLHAGLHEEEIARIRACDG